MTYTGSCLCGGVSFRVEGDLDPIQVCHCLQCRKAQGGPFATNIPVATSAFHLLGGEQLLQAYESSPGKQRYFCGRCGSPLYSRRETLPGVIRIRAGLFDQPLATQLAWHAYTESKANWWPVEDGLPQHPEGYSP